MELGLLFRWIQDLLSLIRLNKLIFNKKSGRVS